MPPRVSRILYDSWELTSEVTSSQLSSELKSRVFFDQCIGPTARRYLPGYHWQPQVGGCTDQCSADGADPYCFDRSCPIPEYCDGANGNGACYRFYGPTVNDTDGCLADMSCNWKRCIPGEPTYAACMASCTSGTPDVCVDCSGDWCQEVTAITDQTRCEQGLCDVDDTETTSTGCANKGRCSAVCPLCNTQAGCQAQGSCNDQKLVPEGVEQGGYCFVAPTFDAQADEWECADDSLMTLRVVGCVYKNYTDTECTSVSGTWVDYATDSGECATAMGCYSVASGELAYQSQSQCSSCAGFQWRAHFNWTSSSVWTPGHMQTLSWRPRAIVPTNTVGRALSYTELMSVVSEAVTSQYAYAYRTQALCQLDAPLRLIRSATCDCNGGAATDCFGSISDSQVGSGLGCSSLSSTIETPVAQLEIHQNSFPQSRCSAIGMYFTPASQYQLSSSFNLAVFRASAVNSFWIVKNQNDAAIGQIISGAVKVELASNLDQPATLCINVDSSLGVDETAITYAFAELDEEEEVRAFPSNLAASLDQQGRVCGPITKSGTYFATKLEKDYEDQELRTKSEKAQYLAATVLFAACAVFGIIQAILLLQNAANEKILVQKLVFVGIITVDCIVRAVFVALPPNAFKPSAVAGQFTIFELPSFLFFTVFTAIVYLWIMVIAKTGVLGNRREMKKRRQVIFRTYVGGNIAMYLIFIIFIILIAVLPRLQEKSPCFLGTASSDAAGSDVSYTIKLAYWIFLFIVSVVAALVFLIAAVLLLRLMSRSTGMKRKRKASAQGNTTLYIITSVATVCSVVILIRSSLFLWAAKTGNAVNVLVFAFLEIIPQAMLLFYLHPFSVFRENSSDSSDPNRSSEWTNDSAGSRGTRNTAASRGGGSSKQFSSMSSNGGSAVELEGVDSYKPKGRPAADSEPTAIATLPNPERQPKAKRSGRAKQSSSTGEPRRKKRVTDDQV